MIFGVPLRLSQADILSRRNTIPGRVSPDFLEEQRDGVTEDEEDAEVVPLLEGRPNRQGTPAPQPMVRIPSTSDLSVVLCSHSRDPDYCHDCADFGRRPTKDSHVVFVRPPGTPRHPLGSLDGVSPTGTQGEKPLHGDAVTPSGRIRGYLINNKEEEKENYQDASRVSQVRQVAERMGDGRGAG